MISTSSKVNDNVISRIGRGLSKSERRDFGGFNNRFYRMIFIDDDYFYSRIKPFKEGPRTVEIYIVKS